MRSTGALQEAIGSFLAARSFAVIGVSEDRKKFGNLVFRALRERGFSVIPVHRTLARVEGTACRHTVAELKGAAEALVTAVHPEETERLLAECAGGGFTHVWMVPGSESARAVRLAQEHGVKVIHGECPLMFLESVRSVHAVHRFLKKLTRRYPTPAAP